MVIDSKGNCLCIGNFFYKFPLSNVGTSGIISIYVNMHNSNGILTISPFLTWQQAIAWNNADFWSIGALKFDLKCTYFT